MIAAPSTAEKVKEIISEMKDLQLWKTETPAWVMDYEKKSISSQQDFTGWLQFVFLPNCLLEVKSDRYIVLQAKQSLAHDVQKGKLLQLLIELDALY